MNPSAEEVYEAIKANKMNDVLLGKECRFITPPMINDDMQPTDHEQLLTCAIYPLANKYGASKVQKIFEKSLKEIATDGLGLYCAIQCFYIQVVKERSKKSDISINKSDLAKSLGESFNKKSESLHFLEIRKGNLSMDYCYKRTLSRMIILSRDYGIDWGIGLPEP